MTKYEKYNLCKDCIFCTDNWGLNEKEFYFGMPFPECFKFSTEIPDIILCENCVSEEDWEADLPF